MSVVEDFAKMLDRIPIWKRMGEVPGEVDDLKKRVAALEEMLNGKWPADVCRKCGARAARLYNTEYGGTGFMHEQWICKECGETDFRQTKAV